MKKLRENYLDGERLYRQYFLMGAAASSSRIQKFAVSCGMLSPEGNEPTTMGVWKAMWRWASLKENKDLAFSIFSDYVDNYNWRLPDPDLPWDGDRDELWHEFMMQKIRTAWQFSSERRLRRFLKKNGWTS